MPLDDRRLYLLFTPSLCRADPTRTLAAALRGGVDLVQWRTKTPDADGLGTCRTLCDAAGVPLIINDDVDLAIATDAAGAHVGQDDLPAAAARRLLGSRLLGVSTHDDDQIRAAITAGADHLGFGPCFPTETKGYLSGQPDDAIRRARQTAGPVPLYAIGGITTENLPHLMTLGIDRIAVSSAILHSADPENAAAELRQQL